MPDVRPDSSATPFRVTIHGLGAPRTFPMQADAAYDNAKRAALWRDEPPFPADIFDYLDDRDVLAATIVRVIIALARRADGTLYWTDDDGHVWGILGHTITGVEVEDPDARNRKGRAEIGFAFPAGVSQEGSQSEA
jgi:hypothetical protein